MWEGSSGHHNAFLENKLLRRRNLACETCINIKLTMPPVGGKVDTNRYLHCANWTGHSLPEELCGDRSHLEDATSQALILHEGGRAGQLLLPHQFTRDTCRHARLAGRHDDTHTRVTTSSHGATSCIHHEAHEETVATHGEKSVN